MEGKLPSERDFYSEGGDVSDLHLHTPPLIASAAAIYGGGDHQSSMAAVVSDNASKNLAFE